MEPPRADMSDDDSSSGQSPDNSEEWLRSDGFFESSEFKQDLELEIKQKEGDRLKVFNAKHLSNIKVRDQPPMKPKHVRDSHKEGEEGPSQPIYQGVMPYNSTRLPSKGHLVFDCDFESGNIGTAIRYDEMEYEIKIRPDSNSPRHRIWYYFRVRNFKKDQRVIFHFSNYSKSKALFSQGFTPMVRTNVRTGWSRIPSQQMFYYRCSRHKKRHCFSFTFHFDESNEEYFFAYSYPYTYTYLQKWLHSIELLNLPFLRRDLLCRTVLQRRLDLLTITGSGNLDPGANDTDVKTTERATAGSNKDEQDGAKTISNCKDNKAEEASKLTKKAAIVLTSRIHPGETPASFIIHGLVEFLISDHPVAQFLRDECIFYVIPMLNPDGVFLGNYRCNVLGLDLNRHWRNPNWRSHPTITAVKMLIRQLSHVSTVVLDYFIDIHAHTTATNGFVYCNEFTADSNKNDLTTVFPRLLDLYSPDFTFDKCKFCRNPKKAGSGRRAMGDTLNDNTICYTLEVSYYCSVVDTKSNIKGEPYTEENYRDMGKCMARAFGDVFQTTRDERWKLGVYQGLTKLGPMKGMTKKDKKEPVVLQTTTIDLEKEEYLIPY